MPPHVLQFEPEGALFVNSKDALLFYRRIARVGKLHLKDGGSLYFETNEYNALKERDLLLFEYAYQSVVLEKDMQGKDRMIRAEKN